MLNFRNLFALFFVFSFSSNIFAGLTEKEFKKLENVSMDFAKTVYNFLEDYALKKNLVLLKDKSTANLYIKQTFKEDIESCSDLIKSNTPGYLEFKSSFLAHNICLNILGVDFNDENLKAQLTLLTNKYLHKFVVEGFLHKTRRYTANCLWGLRGLIRLSPVAGACVAEYKWHLIKMLHDRYYEYMNLSPVFKTAVYNSFIDLCTDKKVLFTVGGIVFLLKLPSLVNQYLRELETAIRPEN